MRTSWQSPRRLSGLAVAVALSVGLANPGGVAATNLCDCDLSPTAIQVDLWLDPGHDPVHKGNPGLNLNLAPPNEEDVAWAITNDLNNALLNSGYCALLTRLNFSTVYSPRQRACIASGRMLNDSGDRAFAQGLVSIHTNSASPAVFGTLTVYPSVKSCARQATGFLNDQSFAADLQAAMSPQMALAYLTCSPGLPCNKNLHECASGQPCAPGTKSMIEEARIPAVIVEVGYQTNVCQECAMRLQPSLIANAVAAGIFNTFISPTACASPEKLWSGGSSAVGARPRETGAVLADAPRRIATRPVVSPRAPSFSEGFEGATFPPSGWSIQTSGAPPANAWARTASTFYVASGVAAAFIGSGLTTAKDEWLISSAITLGASDTGLQFSWVGNRVYTGEVEAQALARPSGGGAWTTLWSLSSEPYGNAFAVKSKVVSLGAFAGQTIQVAFRALGTNGADFSVDDVAVGTFQVSQVPANDLCANAAQLPSGSFSLTGATCRASNNMDPSNGTSSACIGYEMDGPDVFYKLNAGVGDTLTAAVRGPWGPGLYLMRSCSGLPADCVAGAYFEDGELDPSVNVVFTQAGQYFLVVDGPGGSCGDFQLSVGLYGPTVGVGPETPRSEGLLIAPNPMRSQGTISGAFRQAIDGRATLAITDIQGRRVLQRELPISRGRVRWDWNRLSDSGRRTPAGIYSVELRHGDESLRSRVVVRD